MSGIVAEADARRGPARTTRALVGFVLLVVLAGTVLFGAAGTVSWPMGWAYLVLASFGAMGARVAVGRRHPDLLHERARGLKVEGTKPWDRWLVPVVIWGPMVVLVVAGLDRRHEWSHVAPVPLQVAALVAACGGYALAGWAMAENRFFAATARIQTERGHTVVDTGPYRWVRHPGYAASIVATLALPLILDSAWGFVPAGLTALALVVRTALEDAMLVRELPGYLEFTSRTRARLIPGVW